MSGAVADSIASANRLLANGQTDAALEIALRALAASPDDAELHNLAGTVYAKRRDDERAERAFLRSIELGPRSYKPLANLAILRRTQGRHRDALELLERATSLAPEVARLFARKGQLERDLDALDRALGSFEAAFRLEPTPLHREAYARALVEVGRRREAIDLLRDFAERTKDGTIVLARAVGALGDRAAFETLAAETLASSPDPATITALAKAAARYRFFSVGLTLAEALERSSAADPALSEEAAIAKAGFEEALGDADRAIETLVARTKLAPTEKLVETSIEACARTKRFKAMVHIEPIALASFRESLKITRAMGKANADVDRLDDAITWYERALALSPDDPATIAQLASTYGQAGSFERIRVLAARAGATSPEDTSTWSFFLELHDAETKPEVLASRITAWAERAEPGTAVPIRRERSLDPDRRLRVGYLSPDFYEHAVMRFALPLFRHHDASRFELCGYSNASKDDRVTKEIRERFAVFRDVRANTTEEIGKLIADDGVDIAIDLAGLTSASLVRVLCARPAPVQMTYLGWPATVGLRGVDFRITDAVADPPGQTEALHTEELVRLPHTAWCFAALNDVPVVPRDPKSPLVLGSFNRAAKLSDELVASWARIMTRLPAARLLLKGRGIFSRVARDRIEGILREASVDVGRVMMAGWAPSVDTHLASWGDVDVALDSFPYSGTTTTCEALWMGVPVVTRAGRAHVSRVGASLLHAVGLDDLVADDWPDYEASVVRIAQDEARRIELRRTLRDRFRASELGSAERFTRSFEAMLRAQWRRHVASAASSGAGGAV